MGAVHSDQMVKQYKTNREIEKQLQESKTIDDRTIKTLLLGTGECGKSTLMKQMRLIHTSGFTEEELLQQRSIVYNNTVMAMFELLNVMQIRNIPFADRKRTHDAQIVLDVVERDETDKPFSEELANALKRLWLDDGLCVEAYRYRLKYHLHESTKYFFDNFERISDPSYRPSGQDLVMTRMKTTGIIEITFTVQGVDFRVFDVGGQRSERKKWIHCFEAVGALIFITAVSEYDEVLSEDKTTNRLFESVCLFETICNSRWFLATALVLFLNKMDVFREKIPAVSIRACFPDYIGAQTVEESIEFVKTKFESAVNYKIRKNRVFMHETCATDSNQIQKIMESVITTILKHNLNRVGLV